MPESTEKHLHPPKLIQTQRSDALSLLERLEGQTNLVLQLSEPADINLIKTLAGFPFEVGIVTNPNGSFILPGTRTDISVEAIRRLGLDINALRHNHPSGRLLPSGPDMEAATPEASQYITTPKGFAEYKRPEGGIFNLLYEDFHKTADPDTQLDVFDRVNAEELTDRAITRLRQRGKPLQGPQFEEYMERMLETAYFDAWTEWFEDLSITGRNAYLDPLLQSRPDLVRVYGWDDQEEAAVMVSGGTTF